MVVEKVDRRTVLKSIGVAGATGVVSSEAAAKPGRESVPGKAPSTEVLPFGCPDRDSDGCSVQEVPPGNWIVHTVWWIEQGARQCKGEAFAKGQLNKFLERQQTTAVIGGEKVENASQYWGEPYYEDDFDNWAVQWKYVTPPKEEGTTNTFRIRHTFDPPHTLYDPDNDGTDVCETVQVTSSDWIQGAYTVS